jgi:hypothetical protein
LSGSSVPTFRDNLSVPSSKVKKSKKKKKKKKKTFKEESFLLGFFTFEDGTK